MQDKARAPSSALRPSQASAAELVAGGAHIAIPAKQPLGELTQGPVTEYALSARPAAIDAEEAILIEWAELNHRLFSGEEIQKFEIQAAPKGGGSEHDAWKIETASGAVSGKLTAEFGRGYGQRNLARMVQFAEVFPDPKILTSLMTKLGWTHFLHIIRLDDPRNPKARFPDAGKLLASLPRP